MVAFAGAERIMLALSRHLIGNNIAHQFALYYLSVDLQSHTDWELPIVELLPSRNPLTKARSLKKYLMAQQAAGSGTVLLVGIQAALHAGILGTRDYVLMILDTPSLIPTAPSPGSPLGRFKQSCRNWASGLILQRGMRRAKSVIATSQYMAQEMKQLYGVESVIARQGGLPPTPKSREKASIGEQCLRMLSVSRLEANKRIDWILRALSDPEFTDGHRVPWHLDIVGDGSERSRLQALAQSLGLQQRVTFHGFVSDAKLEEAYSRASLFLMPAIQGYGLPALEALSRRVPVVMHRDSGVSETFRGTPWVELIDGDPNSLIVGVCRMLGRIKSGQLASAPLPSFPSESDWAERISQICGWS
jgi:glycosyltransferase involved in cell wall biosynthesis